LGPPYRRRRVAPSPLTATPLPATRPSPNRGPTLARALDKIYIYLSL
jgi:hypothetical protein